MKVMVLVKATEDSENGVMPSTKDLEDMGGFNEELVKAGVMLDGDGLRPSTDGVRISYPDGEGPSVTDGPFAETKELVAGFWVWQVRDLDEAIEWAKRIPFNHGESVELRPFFEVEDFGDAVTPELERRFERMREDIGSE
ncbi:MAG: YciI family protein [Solirubrobacterales bacterium]|nr:YciI family protein [Solirubrobacterales bacterium]MCO5327718.1 YciI family protein [Solirubrobacterales bacterium]